MSTTRVFKSGNSVAVRLPKSTAFAIGTEVEVLRDGDRIVIQTADRSKDRIDVDKFWGTVPGFMSEGRIDLEFPERDWSARPEEAA